MVDLLLLLVEDVISFTMRANNHLSYIPTHFNYDTYLGLGNSSILQCGSAFSLFLLMIRTMLATIIPSRIILPMDTDTDTPMITVKEPASLTVTAVVVIAKDPVMSTAVAVAVILSVPKVNISTAVMSVSGKLVAGSKVDASVPEYRQIHNYNND